MSNFAYHTGPKGATIYAKPLDLVETPWTTDVVNFTESAVAVPVGKRNSFKSNAELDPTKSYQVFQQVGGAKASTDLRVATIPQRDDAVSSIKTKTDLLALDVTGRVTVGLNQDKSDYQIASDSVTTLKDGLARESNATTNKTGVLEAIEAIEVSPVVNISILPGTVRQAELQKGSRLRAYTGQRSPILATVFDAANEPVDLSNRTLVIKIASANEVAFTTILNADITVTGTDNNSFYFDPSEELVERARVFQWSLRDTADDANIGSGELEIIYAP